MLKHVNTVFTVFHWNKAIESVSNISYNIVVTVSTDKKPFAHQYWEHICLKKNNLF